MEVSGVGGCVQSEDEPWKTNGYCNQGTIKPMDKQWLYALWLVTGGWTLEEAELFVYGKMS